MAKKINLAKGISSRSARNARRKKNTAVSESTYTAPYNSEEILEAKKKLYSLLTGLDVDTMTENEAMLIFYLTNDPQIKIFLSKK